MLDDPWRVLGGLQREICSLGLSVALALAHRSMHLIEALERVGLIAG